MRPNGRSSQLATKEFARATVGKGCGGGIVVRPIMPREGMILAWIAVDCRLDYRRRFNASDGKAAGLLTESNAVVESSD